MRGNRIPINGYSNIGIYTGNSTFPMPGNFTTSPAGFNKVLEILITDFTNYFDWHQFSYEFTNIGNTSSFFFRILKVQLLPIYFSTTSPSPQ
jgi:hypothetical protein